MSDKEGFGMTKYSANYTTFMPFFMELSHTPLIIRGEVMVVVGVVKNYLDDFIKVSTGF